MSWRGSTGHLDGNVPDYQKVQYTRYPSSGWSSMQTGLSGLSGRSQSSNYLTPRNRHSYVDSGRLSGRPTSPPYQPSKYGLPSDLSYNPTVGDGMYRNSNFNEDVFNMENGYERRSSHGYLAQEFDFGPYRSNSQRGSTDYSSDTGGGYRSNIPHNVDYSSDSGRGHVTRHMTDYSSDSGLNYRRQRRKSVELDMPSPIMSRKERMTSANEDLFTSPVKVSTSEFQRLRDNIPQSRPSHHDFETDNHVSSHGRALPDSPRNTTQDNHRLSPDIKPESDRHNSISNHEHSFDHENPNHSDEHLHDLDHLHSHDSDQIQSHDTDHILANNNGTTHSGRGVGNHVNSHETDHINSHEIDQINSHVTSPRHNAEPEESESRLDFMSPPLYRGRNAKTEQPRVTKKPPTHKASDLTHWQQRHRSQDSHADSDDQLSYKSHHRHVNPDSHAHDHYMRRDQLSPRETRSHQLESIRSAADAIIRDKDAIIEDLRRQIIGQEETIKEYENKLRRTLMSRSSDQGESANFSKMKDLEYRNAQLRTQVANLKLQKEAEIEELEIKMGGVEHEVVQLRAALRKSQPNHAEMKDKLQQKDREIEEWKDKFTGLKESHSSLKEQLDSLERYIADLPAPEEFSKTAEETVKEENQLKKEQIESLEDRLKDTTELLSERELTVTELENKQQHLASKMKDLTQEIQYIKSEGEGRALQQAQEDLQDALEVKERVTLDLEKAKNLLEINHRKVRQLEVKHQNEVRQLQERLQQEEESVVALREEGRLKEQQMTKLKKSLKEFAGKNQDLMDGNLILKDQIKQHEAMSADENQKLQRRFVSEMSICFSELQSLVQICVQRAEGKEPDISLLLGMAGTSLEEEEQGAVGGVKKDDATLKHWFKKLKELRSEVEKIRKMICNKYAEDLGDNLNCATQ